MNENERQTPLEIVNNFANQLSLDRVKTEGIFFDRDYKRDTTTNQMFLAQEKAVVRTHGKTNKIPIGENETHKTYEEAEKFAKEHWSEYFKKRRQLPKSDKARDGERRRQQMYYQRRKQKAMEISQRQ